MAGQDAPEEFPVGERLWARMQCCVAKNRQTKVALVVPIILNGVCEM